MSTSLGTLTGLRFCIVSDVAPEVKQNKTTMWSKSQLLSFPMPVLFLWFSAYTSLAALLETVEMVFRVGLCYC